MPKRESDTTGARKVMSNTFYLLIDWFSITVLGYLFWVTIAKMLHPSELGFFSTISNASFIFAAVTTLGFGNASIRLISKYLAKRKRKRSSGTMRHILKLSTLNNILISIFLVVLIFIFGPFGEFDFYVIMGIVIHLISHSLYTLSNNFLTGLQKMKIIFKTNLLSYLLRLLIVVILIYIGFSYFGPVLAFAISVLFAFIIRLRHFNLKGGKIIKKEIMYYSIPAMFISIGWSITAQSNIILLSILGNMTSVGMFTIGFLFAALLRAVPQTISFSIQPTISQQWELRESLRLKRLIEQSIRYSLFVMIPAAVFFIMLPVELIQLFSTVEYIPASLSMQILIAGSLLIGISMIFHSLLYNTGNVNEVRNAVLGGGILNVILCLILIPSYGMEGAAVASLTSAILLTSITIFYVRKRIKFYISLQMLFKIIVAMFAVGIITFLIKGFIFSYMLRIITSVLVGLTIYVSLLYILDFFEETDVKVLKNAERKAPKIISRFLRTLSRLIERRLHK